jgi:soluble lytic murein transglycosylase-like protein
MSLAYETDADGGTNVLVNGEWQRPVLAKGEADDYAKWMPAYLELARANERRTGVPAWLTLAIIYAETGGRPAKFGPTFDGGVGPMMITSSELKGGHSTQELLDPELNIQIGTDFLARIRRVVGNDVPQTASAYNAGYNPKTGAHRSSSAPWGWKEYVLPDGNQPYISRVVRASNTGIDMFGATAPSQAWWTAAKVIGGGALLGLAVVAGAQAGRAAHKEAA